MDVTQAAEDRLNALLRRASASVSASGLRFEGYVGTCRGSTPLFKPVARPAAGDWIIQAGALKLFVPPEYRQILEQATLDYDAEFMGRGLLLTWPHSPGCPCHA